MKTLQKHSIIKLCSYTLLFLLVPLNATSVTGPVAGGYRIEHTESYVVDEHGTKKRVTNNHASGFGIFVPTNSALEWTTFFTSPPAGVLVEDVLSCPTGFVLVPADGSYTTSDFCVMQYEAKNVSGNPTSQAASSPWVNINRATAISECQSLGANYDLISNNQWQTIAQNAEMQDVNWTGGSRGSGCLFSGNSGDSTCGYDGADPESGTGRNSRAKLTLSNGSEIWDLAGNVYEWVKDNNSTNYGFSNYMSQSSGAARTGFGPKMSDYTCNLGNDFCGFGGGVLNSSAGGIYRGDCFDGEAYAGAFATDLSSASSDAFAELGFRCVYAP